MTREELLQLQAWTDGELPEAESRRWQQRVDSDPQARAVLHQLQQVQTLLQAFDESQIRLPESREFYWSKIARAIQAQAQPTTTPILQPWSARISALKRWLAPAAALATLAAALLLTLPSSHPTEYPELDLAFTDSEAATYRDDARSLTLVWFTYPAEK